MKRIGNLWPQVVSFENLLLAWTKARRGKRSRRDVSDFAFAVEPALLQLQRELQSGTYRPGIYRQFFIRERKPRLISAAPFQDRVVHHAIMNVLEPLLEKRFYAHSYACRKGKGTHRAVDYYQQQSQRFAYVLKLDIARYFPSVRHDCLKAQYRRFLKDPQLLNLLDTVIDHSPVSEAGVGLPIGNLTSQYFANLYLNDLDHWIVCQPECGAYLRYVDDLLILGDSKPALWGLRNSIAQRLGDLGLHLHPHKQQIVQTRDRVDVLGYKVSRHRRWLRNDNGYRFRRTLAAWREKLSLQPDLLPRAQASLMAWVGHARHAQTQGLRKQLFAPISTSHPTAAAPSRL